MLCLLAGVHEVAQVEIASARKRFRFIEPVTIFFVADLIFKRFRIREVCVNMTMGLGLRIKKAAVFLLSLFSVTPNTIGVRKWMLIGVYTLGKVRTTH